MNAPNDSEVLRVVIIGGGLAGLCVAQGLSRAGIAFDLYERDESADVHDQGYRIGINTDGARALYDCLPENLFNLVVATSTVPLAGRVVLLDNELHEQVSRPLPTPVSEVRSLPGIASRLPFAAVNRQTLREILMHKVRGRVHFGKTFTRFEHERDCIRAYFSDGTAAEGDVLVGADGTRSAVRRGLLPDAKVVTLGHAIYGKTPITHDALGWMPDSLISGFSRVHLGDQVALGAGAFRKRHEFESAAAKYAPGIQLTPTPDYLMWTLRGPHVDKSLYRKTPRELCAAAASLLKGAHQSLRRIVNQAETDATFLVELRRAEAVTSWSSLSITLVGDAIHTMSPGRGEGANIALRDAALLCRKLVDAMHAGKAHEPAMSEYQTEMLAYGFEAVARSRRSPFFKGIGH
jgi:2-polyprenyl-6-methoxyphenol hydroxylase-like FAD-dependent oxidoreductase